jgi:hypothetical protein
MAHRGYFVIADITGYTAFMTGSELDHAQDILKTLFNTLLDHIKPPLIISNFQGDAILTYAPEGSFVQGQTLLEIIENVYCEFIRTLETMQRNTTCTCRACSNMSKLDLKMFVHHGEYLIQDMRGKAELSGPDVIIAHRMMKNEVKEKTGLKAYTLFSDTAVNSLSLQDFTCEMHAHSETYEHIGEVKMHAYCLKTMWEREREKRRTFVTPEEAILVVESEVAAPPAVAWDYLNEPERARRVMGVKNISYTDVARGRKEAGSVMHCAHGNDVAKFVIMDWLPFEYRTDDCSGFPGGVHVRITTRLTPTETGTRVQWIVGRWTGTSFKSRLVARLAGSLFTRFIAGDYKKVAPRLREVIEADSSAGQIVLTGQPALQPA